MMLLRLRFPRAMASLCVRKLTYVGAVMSIRFDEERGVED